MPRGPIPFHDRRQLARRLRDEGLMLKDIGKRMGVSYGGAAYLIKSSGPPVEGRGSLCAKCKTVVDRKRKPWSREVTVLCLGCLSKTKNPSFGTRLRAYRLAAGLSLAELARRIGTPLSVVADWERAPVNGPTWRMLIKLVHVLGQGLVSEPPL
jgi:DNA-binding transcriptional regulator YiaG